MTAGPTRKTLRPTEDAMNSKIITTTNAIAIATSIIAAATLAAPTAEAGMRIHFGFPIGSFIAGGGHHHHHRHHCYDDYSFRRAERYRAYERAQAAEAARLRREKAAAVAAARRAKKEQQAAAAVAAKAEAERRAAEAATLAAAKKKQQAVALAAAESNQEALAAKEDVAVLATSNPTTAPEVSASNSEPVKTASVSSLQKPEGNEPAKLECKRYFANVGMTISVPCSK